MTVAQFGHDEVARRAAAGTLPSRWSMRISDEGILTVGAEEIVVEQGEPRVGQAVCLLSGSRIAFRRVLDIGPGELLLRADIAPFEDRWTGGIVGCVQPRAVDRVALINPVYFTRSSWYAAVASAHLRAVQRRLKKSRTTAPFALETHMLEDSDWPGVRAFWKSSCGRELPVEANPNQHVVGLFDGRTLIGVNIHLAFGRTAYSAFTLVDRRYRGSGGGRKMIEHAVRVSRERKFESIFVHINVRNLPSIAAYRSVGFHPTRWWADEGDPLASAERHQMVFELNL